MIEWLTLEKFEARLTQYPPIGLHLRGFFHGRVAASLPVLFEREPEVAEIEGLGDVTVWAGLVDETPFSVTAQRRGEVTGFEISFPVCVNAGRIDVALLDAVAAIAPAFRSPRGPHIESLPFTGGGWGVLPIGSNQPLFRSGVKEDAEAVARFLDDPGRYEVAIIPVAPVQWVVAGPRSGAVVSRLEVLATRAEAEDAAKGLSVEHGIEFTIHEGQLPPS